MCNKIVHSEIKCLPYAGNLVLMLLTEQSLWQSLEQSPLTAYSNHDFSEEVQISYRLQL